MTEQWKEKAIEFADAGLEPGISFISDLITTSLVGHIVPGLVSARLAYKQQRAEERINKALFELKNKQRELEWQLSRLPEQFNVFFKEKIWPIFLDNVIEEQQDEKIEYLVNSLVTIVYDHDHFSDEELVFTYYDILAGLRLNELLYFINVHAGPAYYGSFEQWAKKRSSFIHLLYPNEDRSQVYSYIEYVNRKLLSLALIKEQERKILFDTSRNDMNISRVNYEISSLGTRFAWFLRARTDSKKEQD